MTGADFSERMSRVPDEELVSILASEGFLPEAVEAARAEFERRNLNPNDVARMSAHVAEVRHEEEGKADLPLSTAAKVAFFCFGFFIFWSIAAAVLLSTRGYKRKSTEAFKLMAIGTGFWLALFLVMDLTGIF